MKSRGTTQFAPKSGTSLWLLTVPPDRSYWTDNISVVRTGRSGASSGRSSGIGFAAPPTLLGRCLPYYSPSPRFGLFLHYVQSDEISKVQRSLSINKGAIHHIYEWLSRPYIPDIATGRISWSGRLDLNQRPPRPERGALPTALRPDTSYHCNRTQSVGQGYRAPATTRPALPAAPPRRCSSTSHAESPGQCRWRSGARPCPGTSSPRRATGFPRAALRPC